MKVIRTLSLLLICLLVLTSCSFWGDPGEETYTRRETESEREQPSETKAPDETEASSETTDSGETETEKKAETVTVPSGETQTEPESAGASATETEAKTETETESKENTTLPSVDPPPTQYTILEDLSNHENVIAMQGISLPKELNCVAYQILYRSAGLQISAELILPSDYDEETYPVILYFSEKVGMNDSSPDARRMAETICQQGAIVVHIYARGQDDSNGATRLWGSDIDDVTNLFTIFDSSLFLQQSDYYAIGSGEGSVAALRLAAMDTNGRIKGCAVINPITDLNAYIADPSVDASRIKAFLRNTNNPEEYALRSAVSFADQFRVPLLIIESDSDSAVAKAQSTLLIEKLVECKNTLYSKEQVTSVRTDFLGETELTVLFKWIQRLTHEAS